MNVSTHTPKPCPICSGQSFTSVGAYHFSDWHDTSLAKISRDHFTYDILSCQICGHIMADHPYGDDFISHLYARPQGTDCWSNDPDHDPLDIYRDMILFSLNHLPTHGIIADCGAGNGQILSLLHDEHSIKNTRLLGVDFSNYMNNNLPFHAQDLNKIEGSDMPHFDFVFCTHLLEHVFDPRAFLRGLNARANNGAKLYLETPDIARTDNKDLKDTNLFNPQHLHQFSLDNLIRLAESTGWKVLNAESLISGFVPRARLIAEKIDTQININGAIQALDSLRYSQKRLLNAVENHMNNAPLALWGVGGDLMAILHDNAKFKAYLAKGNLVLFDQGLAGKYVCDVAIQPTSTLAAFKGQIIMTPRPSKTKEPMKRYAHKAGFQDRLIDPYEGGENE